MKFNGNFFKENNVSFLHKKVVNLYITYQLDAWSRDINIDLTWANYLFGVAKVTNNADPDKYGYNGYGIGFDARSKFSWSGDVWDENVIIFGADMTSSVHVNIS